MKKARPTKVDEKQQSQQTPEQHGRPDLQAAQAEFIRMFTALLQQVGQRPVERPTVTDDFRRAVESFQRVEVQLSRPGRTVIRDGREEVLHSERIWNLPPLNETAEPSAQQPQSQQVQKQQGRY